MEKRNMRVDISILRIAATLAVVFLHTNNTISNNRDIFLIDAEKMRFFSINNFLMNWAVPVFFMITGVLLLDSNKFITFKACVNKYSRRIVLALFTFGVPFSMLEIFVKNRKISFFILEEAIGNVITGNSWSHLWYLYTLIGIYLILPILKTFVNNAEKATVRYIIWIFFIFDFCKCIFDNILGVSIAFEIPIGGFAIFYVLLGKYLTDRDTCFCNKKICSIFILISVVCIVGGGMLIENYEVQEYFGYNSPVIVLLSISIFMMFQGITCKRKQNVWKIDRLCFAVYLIHPVFINFFYKFLKITPLCFGNFYFIGVVIFWILFVILSFCSAWIMHHITLLKKYIL